MKRGLGLSRSLLQAAAGGRDAGDRSSCCRPREGKRRGWLLGCCRLCRQCRGAAVGKGVLAGVCSDGRIRRVVAAGEQKGRGKVIDEGSGSPSAALYREGKQLSASRSWPRKWACGCRRQPLGIAGTAGSVVATCRRVGFVGCGVVGYPGSRRARGRRATGACATWGGKGVTAWAVRRRLRRGRLSPEEGGWLAGRERGRGAGVGRLAGTPTGLACCA